jgi:RNase H-like domain found in reverse transcriptase
LDTEIESKEKSGNKLIFFYSIILSSQERNYPTIEKESISFIYILTSARHSILSNRHKIKILCDHANLENINHFRIRRIRHIRWFKILSEFKFRIQYFHKEHNEGADFLSRPSSTTSTEHNAYKHENLIENHQQIETASRNEIQHINTEIT